MPAPLIGVTSNAVPSKDGNMGTISVSETYIQAVLSAGGIPVILPVGMGQHGAVEVFSRLDGILFTGGADVDPARFDGIPHPRVYGIDPRRDEMEIRLIRMAVEAGRPYLGICRGIQVINVALGGSLFTDIADQLPAALKHDHYPDTPRDFLAHPVQVDSQSRLGQILGGQMVEVNSLHHQGIRDLAPGLVPTAYAADGLVEAVELPGHPFALAVQWHPECLQAHQPQRQLFQALVRSAASR